MIGPWTAEEDALLRQRKAEGAKNEAIAAELNRTFASVKSRWQMLTEGTEAHKARREAYIARNRERHAIARAASDPRVSPRVSRRVAPAEVLAERDASFSAPLSITAYVFGDPVFHRSALAQKQGVARS